MDATFALVIPTHRRPELVVQALDSALRQSRAFDQIIVVVDGTDDPGAAAISRLSPQHSSIEVYAIPHAGVAAARNHGLARVTTDWVSFLDDDDLLHPDFLRDLEKEVLAAPLAHAFNAPYWSFAAKMGPREEFEAQTLDECLRAVETATPRNDMTYLDIAGRSFDLLLAGLRGSMSTASVRSDVLRTAGGFPDGFAVAEDWVMYVNVARFTEWHLLPERRAFFRDHGDNATRHPTPARALTVLKAIASFWEPTSMPIPLHRELAAYRRHYSHELRWALIACLRERDFQSYRSALRISRTFLPRRRDRALAAAPRLVHAALWRVRRMRVLRDV